MDLGDAGGRVGSVQLAYGQVDLRSGQGDRNGDGHVLQVLGPASRRDHDLRDLGTASRGCYMVPVTR
jgi:hypothetical protein